MTTNDNYDASDDNDYDNDYDVADGDDDDDDNNAANEWQNVGKIWDSDCTMHETRLCLMVTGDHDDDHDDDDDYVDDNKALWIIS